jgi:tRNA threonylcarbamoyladenosine biosynthesis protein TsaE
MRSPPFAPVDNRSLDPWAGSLTREDLVAWGAAFGGEARPPLVVAIAGDLGAGKTTLIQAICRGYGVVGDVTSPTFALVHEYASPKGGVYHLDLYRLRDATELTNIGWDDIIAANALVLIEWPERAGDRLPETASKISLAHVTGEPTRRLLSRS